MFGWYLLLTQFMLFMEYPVPLPVGDFSKFWAPKPEKVGQED